MNIDCLEAVVQKCSVKKLRLEISQNSKENTCARVSFFNKVADLTPATLLKKRLWHGCFPVNFVKFIRTPFYTEHLWWLLLILQESKNHADYYSLVLNLTVSLLNVSPLNVYSTLCWG